MLTRALAIGTLARIPSEGCTLAIVLMVAARGGSTAFAGALVALSTFPQFVTGPLGGTLLDRSTRPGRLVAGAAVLASVALAALAAGRASGATAVLAVLALSAVDPLLTGGLSAVLTRWAETGPTLDVSAWDGVAYNIAGVAGPGLVTVVAATVGSSAALWTLAGLAIAAAAAAFGGPALAPHPHEGVRVTAAVRTLWHDRPLRGVTVATTVEAGALGGLALALVAAAASHGHAAEAAGTVLTVRAATALVSSLAMTRWGRSIAALRIVNVSIALAGAGLVAMGAAPWWLLVVLAGLVGLADGPVLVGTYRARVAGSPAGVRASVFTVAASLKLGASSAGALIAGLALTDRATPWGLTATGAVCLAGAAGAALAARQTG